MIVFKFIIRAIIFSLLVIVTLFTIAFYLSDRAVGDGLGNNEIESNIAHFKDNDSFDFVMLGISHARMFSLYENHDIVEKSLGKKFKNIGMGGNLCDVALQRFYLQYFFSRNNKAKEAIIIMSPPMMMNESLSLATNSFFEEPLRWDFLTQYLQYPYGEKNNLRSFYYIKTKLSKYWYNFPPGDLAHNNKSVLERIDTAKVREGMSKAYDGENPLLVFEKNKVHVEGIIKLCKENGMKVTLMITPAVFGKWQYHDIIDNYCNAIKSKYNIEYFDFSEVMMDRVYYYDHHHLNANGIKYFSDNYFKKVFE